MGGGGDTCILDIMDKFDGLIVIMERCGAYS